MHTARQEKAEKCRACRIEMATKKGPLLRWTGCVECKAMLEFLKKLGGSTVHGNTAWLKS